ncbi:hypothetical protein LINPERPRIM_LOCUS41190 [Linum perenne]
MSRIRISFSRRNLQRRLPPRFRQSLDEHITVVIIPQAQVRINVYDSSKQCDASQDHVLYLF